MGTTATLTAKTVSINQVSPGSIQARVQQIQAASKGLDSAQALLLAGQNDQNLQQQIYRLHADMKQLAATVNHNAGVSGGSLVSIQEVTAVHATTTAIPASVTPAVDDILYVFVTQDSTGNGLISWNSLFRFAITDIDTSPNTESVFSFVGRTDSDSTVRWFMTSLPLTGQPALSQV